MKKTITVEREVCDICEKPAQWKFAKCQKCGKEICERCIAVTPWSLYPTFNTLSRTICDNCYDPNGITVDDFNEACNTFELASDLLWKKLLEVKP